MTTATANKTLLAQRVLEMEESATLKMAGMARELKAKGVKVIDLSLGEPDFDTPEHIKQAAWEALQAGYTKYTPVAGLQELRDAISVKFKRDNNLDYAADQILVSNGAKQDIANIALALLNEGDEAIILGPYWVSYKEIVKFAGGVPVCLNAGVEQDFKVSAAEIEAAITDKTKFVLFSSPCNPTGSVFSRAELEAIANVVARHEGIYVVADEIYEYINFTEENVSIGSFPQLKDRVITVNGFSKGFAMTGWRLGYMAGPKSVISACNKIQGQITSGAASFSQKAAAVALLSDMTPTHDMRKAYEQRRGLVRELLSEIPGFIVNNPQGAFYIFPDISAYFGKSDGTYTINNSDDFSEYLLAKAHVATVGGAAFGADNCFRISYAASEENLREGIRRIAEACAALK